MNCSLYDTESLKQYFKDYFVGPCTLVHEKKTLIAEYKDVGEDMNINLNIYVTALPAQFFEIVIFLSNGELTLLNVSGMFEETKLLIDSIVNNNICFEFKSNKDES